MSDMNMNELTQLLARPRRMVFAKAANLFKQTQVLRIEKLEEKLFLAVKKIVDVRRLAFASLGYIPHGCATVALFPEDSAGFIDNLFSSGAHIFDFLNQPGYGEVENFDVIAKMLFLHILIASIFPKTILIVYVIEKSAVIPVALPACASYRIPG